MRPTRSLRIFSLVVSGATLALAVACTDPEKESPKTPAADAQGWTPADRTGWYDGTQGSRLMPWAWMQALEQSGNERPFLEDAHMESFRFLPRTNSKGLRMPVGFALDKQNAEGFALTGFTWYDGMQTGNEAWIGLNCSACHTAQMQHGDQVIRVDGAPSLVDFQGFIEALNASLSATRGNPAKWERFAAKVLAGKDTPNNRKKLKETFAGLTAWQADSLRMNKTPVRYGYARLDAVGHIYNKVAMIVGAEDQKANPSDAPVSYPYIWDIYRQNLLQYDGIAATQRLNLPGGRFFDYGALGRNAGEVIGVFGDVKVEKHGAFANLIQVDSLDALEDTLRKLKPLPWPAAFPAVDPAKVEEGRKLYAEAKLDGKTRCIDCHSIPPATGDAIYNVPMVRQKREGEPGFENNTDPKMACNALAYTAKTGNLQGRYVNFVPTPKDMEKFEATAPLSDMLTATVKGALVAKVTEIAQVVGRIFLNIEHAPTIEGATVDPWIEQLDDCQGKPLFRYKAKPLNGIWATAPFLHNGSVPTMWDLLLAPADRPKSFRVGTRQYDPARGGYVTGEAPGNEFTFDTSVRGNSNMGHDYGVGKLTDAQRAALVEYMKTL